MNVMELDIRNVWNVNLNVDLSLSVQFQIYQFHNSFSQISSCILWNKLLFFSFDIQFVISQWIGDFRFIAPTLSFEFHLFHRSFYAHIVVQIFPYTSKTAAVLSKSTNVAIFTYNPRNFTVLYTADINVPANGQWYFIWNANHTHYAPPQMCKKIDFRNSIDNRD